MAAAVKTLAKNILSTRTQLVSPLYAICSRGFSLLRLETDHKKPAHRFRALPNSENNVYLTYIWIDGTGQNVRGKTKVADREPKTVEGTVNICATLVNSTNSNSTTSLQ